MNEIARGHHRNPYPLMERANTLDVGTHLDYPSIVRWMESIIYCSATLESGRQLLLDVRQKEAIRDSRDKAFLYEIWTIRAIDKDDCRHPTGVVGGRLL